MKKKIVLASSSPNRKDLLTSAGLVFEIDPSDYEEDMTLKLTPQELAKTLSRGKAENVAKRHKDAFIIGADTFVVYKGKLFGKPHTKERNREMLSQLAGTEHSAMTGFTIVDTETGKVFSDFVETKISLKKLTKEEIESYVAKGESLEKAGGYAAQKIGSLFIEKFDGDYSNFIGLPMSKIFETFKNEFGVNLLLN